MIKKLTLENFRSHTNFVLELGHTTILIGPNGAGKTNILESIGTLSFCKSFRDEDKKNLINHDALFAKISCDDLELVISKVPRLSLRAKERGIPRRLTDFIGLIPSVIFSPETVSIITGAPSERRRFLDIMISQTDKEYLRSLSLFKKIRHQRNVLLQRISQRKADVQELSFWDKEFCREAGVITKKRAKVVKDLNELLPYYYKKISGDKNDEITVAYLQNYDGELDHELARLRDREVASGSTIIGPHRDDLCFCLNSKDMHNFASRGELKSAIMALKVAELNYLQQEAEKRHNYGDFSSKPLLLLDDVFSEFDPKRRQHLLGLIKDYQSIITTTEKENLSQELILDAKIIAISKKEINGKVK